MQGKGDNPLLKEFKGNPFAPGREQGRFLPATPCKASRRGGASPSAVVWCGWSVGVAGEMDADRALTVVVRFPLVSGWEGCAAAAGPPLADFNGSRFDGRGSLESYMATRGRKQKQKQATPKPKGALRSD